MAWPMSQDYNEAIQNPARCFADPELRQGEAVTNALGLPVPCSGNFADVYQVRRGERSWAVKCFTRQIPGLRERYAEISKYLRQVRLPFLVEFTYLEQGIRVRGRWYPLLKMDWVEGLALNTFVRDHLDQPQVLESLSQVWLKLARRLREAPLAHCDLQHGNVLLVPGGKGGALGVKLVDYDGMCVPSLTLLKSIEVGHPNYQHPQRAREGAYGLEIDRFAHLVIFTALRALVVGGRGLWERYDNGDNLLFRQKDFEAPERSPLFQELQQSNDKAVRRLAGLLAQACREPLERTPMLGGGVAEAPRRERTTPQRASARQEAPSAERIFASATSALLPSSPRTSARRKRRALLGVAGVGAALLLVGLTAMGAFLLHQKPGDTNTAVANGPAAEARLGLGPVPAVTLVAGRNVKVMIPLEKQNCPGPTVVRLEGLPKGVTAVQVADDAERAEIELQAMPLAQPGPAKVRLVAAVRAARATAAVEFDLTILPGPVIRLQFPEVVALEAGQRQKVRVKLERQGDLGSVEVRLEGLPPGLTAPPVQVAAENDTAVIELSAAGGLSAAEYKVRVLAPGMQVLDQKPLLVWIGVINSIGMKMARIPAGRFVRGSPADEEGRPDSHPDPEVQHDIAITRPFLMGVYEVTQEEYQKVTGKNPSHFSPSGPGKDQVRGQDTRRFPVESVSWADARRFCELLSALPEEKKAGRVYRLPTEAEWEYACRAGTTTAFHYGKSLLPEQANYKDAGLGRTTSVGSYLPSGFGLYDLHGNVWEWCKDWRGDYDGKERQNPQGPADGRERIFRGGSWHHAAHACRSAYRNSVMQNFTGDPYGGFRVVCVDPP